ncbi:zinc-dependent alcohol dehydrogenase family protein [Lyngbya confervoides]|uniref:alcohol dehydrogenase n=1 Tax=Lyngbya confervoides BDU141951 TaxID=1574623 RepID=A0ABD4T0F1_9CYAN|nr:zinc-dependent alcohol dehydrogenase family protein [Lyngbya confervoides]MCM1981835.1 zinc-dependent alcohol dehydrogenase family protein [Lyngbya confervoides BDU141951]
MELEHPSQPLRLVDRPVPVPGEGQVLIQVIACGVCRTDLHIIEGDLPTPKLPLVLGHQIVGRVIERGKAVQTLSVGQRVGVPWLGETCGHCHYCQRQQENLCEQALFTGYTLDGGFADYAIAQAQYCFSIPAAYSALQAAPLLCAGLIGYRAYRMTQESEHIGFYGFGAAAHILIQIASHEGRSVYALTKPGDRAGQQFALDLGAVWAGGSDQLPPRSLDAAILFAPVGSLVPAALSALDRGGIVVCAGIHMSDIPTFPYRLLWHERQIRSVANLTRQDGEEFMALASQIPLHTHVTPFPLEQANQALAALRNGTIQGSAVLAIHEDSGPSG